MSKVHKETWSGLKKVISQKNKPELIKLIADLYGMDQGNKDFIIARYSSGTLLTPYKEIIKRAINPSEPWKEDLSLVQGRKAISDYFKATGDKIGRIELMLFYIEAGNNFTLTFGDIDERFYSSLESMFIRVLRALEKQPEGIAQAYSERLEKLNEMVRDKMGWGYPDDIDKQLYAFNKKKGFL